MSAGLRAAASASSPTASCSTAARRCRSRSATWSIRSTWSTRYGVDQVRYFFLREVAFGQDGSYSHEAIVNRINADLANDLGNLAQRSLSMIAKNCDGKIPQPGAFTDADQAILAAADALYAKAREAMDRQAIKHVARCHLGGGGATPTAISPARSRGPSARPIPSAWRRSSTSRPRWCGRSAILAQPVDAGLGGKLLDLLGAAGSGAHVCRRWGRPADCNRGRRLPAPDRCFPALCRGGRRRQRRQAPTRGAALMLVDHHCHLDFPGLRRRPRRRGRRARRRPASALMVTISTRVRQFDADPRRSPRRYDNVLLLGRHASALRRTRSSTSPSTRSCALARHPKVRGDRRGGARLLLREQPARGAGRRASARTSPPRARPACRSSSTHAMPTTTWPRSSRRRWRRGHSRPCCIASPAGAELARRGAGARPLRLVLRHPHVQEIGRAARHRRRRCRSTGCWSRPTRRISRPAASRQAQRAGLRGAHRRRAGARSRASRRRRSRARRRRTSSASTPRRRADGGWPA